MFTYIQNNYQTILDALIQHIWLAIVPILISIVIALPLGYLAVRYSWLYQIFNALFGILYSIPSLALFVLLPSLIGVQILSPINIIVALTIYTLALLVRSVADALRSVDETVLQAATAVGYTRGRRFLQVELPISVPVMLAGLRVATVSNISLVSVGAIIGTGGLGFLFTRGFQLFYAPPIIIGIVLSVLLAIIFDLIIVLIQRQLTPWARVAR